MLTLRPYQIAARNAVLAEWQTGHLNTLLAMSTGTGKTETFLSILAAEKQAGRLGRALVIAHRKELIEQPRDRIIQNWLTALPVPGIVMGNRNEAHKPIIIATIQTLSQPGFKRLRQVLQAGCFTHLVIDECHHSTSTTFRRLIRALRMLNPNLRHVGVTATPQRSDEDGLGRVYDSVAYRLSIKEAISEIGCLAPFNGLGFTLPVSVAKVRTAYGEDGPDYSASDLDRLLAADNVEEIIISKWREFASDRPTIAFTAGVLQAERLAAAFNQAGIPAGWASGNTPQEARTALLRRYKKGEIQVLANCQLWTEGFDAPQTACVIMARPTKSDLVYIQAAGRGLRLAPGKTNCLILDFAPYDARDMVMAGDLLGKPREQRKAEEKAKEEGVILESFWMDEAGEGIDADPDQVIVHALDFFTNSRVQWTFNGKIGIAGLAENLSLAVVLPDEDRLAKAEALKAAGQWKPAYEQELANVASYRIYANNGHLQLVGQTPDWEEAQALAQQYAEDKLDPRLGEKDAFWRNLAPKEGQINFAKRLGVFQPGLNRGQLSQAISFALTENKLKSLKVIK